MVALAELNAAGSSEFTRLAGSLFEATPDLAGMLWRRRPFADAAALQHAASEVIRDLPDARKLAYLAAHPELAGNAARLGQITEHSLHEQAGASLDRLNPGEQAQFDHDNAAYRAKFGFPFIAAVRLHTRASLLAAFATRLANSAETEQAAAIDEICKIVGLRIETLLAS